MTAPRQRRRRGVSTAEVLVGAALSLFAIGGMYTTFLAQHRALAAQNAYVESQTVTRSVVDLFSRELRMAAADPTGTALPTSPGPSCPGEKQGLVEATPSRLHFRQDLDGDGAIASAAEDVLYEHVGEEIRRTDGAGAPVPLVGNVPAGGLIFRYFDGSNPPLELVAGGSPAALTAAQRDCVAKVRFTLTARLPNPDPRNPHPLRSQAESMVAIRQRALANF